MVLSFYYLFPNKNNAINVSKLFNIFKYFHTFMNLQFSLSYFFPLFLYNYKYLRYFNLQKMIKEQLIFKKKLKIYISDKETHGSVLFDFDKLLMLFSTQK